MHILGVQCNDTEVTELDESYNTLYQYSCIDDHFLIDVCGRSSSLLRHCHCYCLLLFLIGYVKLRIEKNIFKLSPILDTYNVSIHITVTEKVGIMSFKDADFILSIEETEMESDIGKLCAKLGRVMIIAIK